MTEFFRLTPPSVESPEPEQIYRKVEYKTLGKSSVEVSVGGGKVSLSLSLHEVLAKAEPLPHHVEAVLNKLGEEGWKVISLDYPYIFGREA